MVWHIMRANMLIVNVILIDRMRMFLNTLTKTIESNHKITFFFFFFFFGSGLINFLFDGLAYNKSEHFAHRSYFSSPLRGSKKYNATRKISARIIC